jgi:glycosyltransferase involved in cell wall biosynthesis
MTSSANPILIFERIQKSELLTVCIPTYNRHQDLAFSLDKLAADYKETPLFDILVVDNNSCDETLQVLKARCLELPSMSVYAWPTNTGCVYNPQQLSSFVETEYMLWLSDDDYMLNGAIKKCLLRLPAFKEQNLCWIFSPLDTYNTDGSILCTASPDLPQSQNIPACYSHYARYAWAFSRQIWKTEHLRASQNIINTSKFLVNSGYWMIYPAVLAISASKAYFWNESLVWHVYGNLVHWEELGQEGLRRDVRLTLDFNITYLLGVLYCLRGNISFVYVYLQLVEFTKLALIEKFYGGERLPRINIKKSINLVVFQVAHRRRLLAISFLIILILGYPTLVINRILNRFGLGANV